jgi:hypothetical protein
MRHLTKLSMQRFAIKSTCPIEINNLAVSARMARSADMCRQVSDTVTALGHARKDASDE